MEVFPIDKECNCWNRFPIHGHIDVGGDPYSDKIQPYSDKIQPYSDSPVHEEFPPVESNTIEVAPTAT